MSEALPAGREKQAAGLASALGLLASTASAAVVRIIPDPVVDTGWHYTPLASWDPTGTSYEAGDGSIPGMPPGTYAATLYGCLGYMSLAVGDPGGVDFYLDVDSGEAPRLSLGDTISPSHTDWSTFTNGWAAYVDGEGYAWGQPFYVGYRIESGADFLYGYARASAETNATPAGRYVISEWAYEDTPNTGITITAIPEPGVLALLFLGIVGLAFHRFFRPRRG
jgi:hypothetical protein